jgi:tetratricopeptide (TPR) repeat protein
MYKLAARNLSQSLAIRSDDSLGYFFYGKVLNLTARKAGEREESMQMFARAIELDRRGANPQSRLYYALSKMGGRTTNNIQEIVGDLKQYVTMYQLSNGGALPPNMGIIYDYMQEAGELNWSALPVANVKNVAGTVTAVTTPPAPTTQPATKQSTSKKP